MEQSIRLERRFAIIDEWLLDLDISDRAVRLYAVLARYADSETHKAYPSRGTLAERLHCSKASVDRAAQELVDAGAMTKKQRHNSSIVYTLQVSSPMNRGVLTGDEGGSAPVMRGVLTSDDLTITTELEPLEREPKNDIGAFTPDELQIHFADFWEAYPLKRGKGAAAKAYEKALKKVAPDYLLDRTRRFRDDPHRPDDFTPLCTTWLNQERWDDEPYKKRDKDKTNSEKNVENLRSAMALLGNDMKEVESEQVRNAGAIDFGVNFRSAQDI
jgi:hypothetical protein